MLDLIASLLVRAFNIFFHIMPMSFNLWVGRRLGTVVYYISRKRRSIAYANLKAAFSAEKTPEELKRITKNTYKNMVQTFVELLSMTKVNKRYTEKYVKIHNFHRIEAASKNPKGMILVSAHFGNWELSLVASVFKGYPLYIITRDQKMERLNELLNLIREMKGISLIRKGADIKNVFRILKDGKSLGLLADQNAGANGELINLFGRPASTAVGPFKLSQKIGAGILPAFIHRRKGLYHELTLEEPMVVGKNDDIIPYMEEYNRLLEKHVREDPDQWLWMHKRWKVTPLKKIMILDDGKKGHLKQSLAVLKQIRRHREEGGFNPGDIEADIVRIKFRNKTTRTILTAANPFFDLRCQGCMRCLKRALDEESYKDVMGRYADIVLSCGSALFAVNHLVAIENNARNLTVLDPGYMNRNKFDIVIVPRHDMPKAPSKDSNIVVTELAPNMIDPDTISSFEDKTVIQDRVASGNGPRLGVLFGGDNPYFTFGEDLTGSVAGGIQSASKKTGGWFYVTTSRRTDPSDEKILKDKLAGDPACIGFVSGREDKDEHTVEKILAFSDVVIVSGESISMVSEAVSSGKPVLVFMPKKRNKQYTKYERFVEGLHQRGYVKRIDPENITEEVLSLIGHEAGFKLPEDNKCMRDMMYKLF